MRNNIKINIFVKLVLQYNFWYYQIKSNVRNAQFKDILELNIFNVNLKIQMII